MDQLADYENKLSQEGEGCPQESKARRVMLNDLAELDRKRPMQSIWDLYPFLPLGQSLSTEFEQDDDYDDDGQADLERLMDEEQEQSAQETLDDRALYDPDDNSMSSHSTSLQLARSAMSASQPPSSDEKPKEPSRKQLKSLQALLRILLESPSPLAQYLLQQITSLPFPS